MLRALVFALWSLLLAGLVFFRYDPRFGHDGLPSLGRRPTYLPYYAAYLLPLCIPILLATLAGAVVCVARLPVPEGALTVCRSLAATATPCALVALGMVLSIQMTSSVRGESHLSWQIPVDLIKLILQPLLTLFALSGLGVSGEWLAMGVILAGMPTGSVAYVLSETYGVAARDASRVILVDTALSVLTIPLMVFLLQRAGIMAGGGL